MDPQLGVIHAGWSLRVLLEPPEEAEWCESDGTNEYHHEESHEPKADHEAVQ